MPDAIASYVLFATDEGCDESLPVASVVDTYTYHRFLPLDILRDGEESKPAGIPGEHLVPGYYHFIEKQLRFPIPRGESETLFPGEFAPAPEPEEVTISDVDKALADGTVAINGGDETITLDREAAAGLIAGEKVLLEVGRDRYVVLVPPEKEIEVPARVAVRDLAGFVATGGQANGIRVPLKPANVAELRQQGVTTVKVGGSPVIVEHVGQPISTTVGQVGQWSSAITDVGDKGEIHTVDVSVTLPVESPDARFALYLTYEQDWKLLGYSRGELLNSIPLTAGEQVTVELHTWDRTTTVTEETSTLERETSLEVQTTTRRTANVLNEVTRANDWKMTVGGSVSLPVASPATVSGELTHETGGKVERVNAGTLETVDEAVWRAANKVRTTHQSKVTVTREVGQELRTTKVLRNQNDCRTLTYDFFEVLGSYEVTTRPRDVRLAVLVPNPIPLPADRNALLIHEGALRSALLDPAYEPGFAAARLLAAQERFCTYVCDVDCTCPGKAPSPSGAAAPGPGEPAPPSGGTATPSDPAERVIQAGERIANAIGAIRNAGWARLTQAYDSDAPQAEKDAGTVEFRQWLYRTFALEVFNGGFWTSCLRFADSFAKDDKSPENVESVVGGAERAWLETTLKAIGVVLTFQLSAPLFAARFAIEFGYKALWYAGFATSFDDAGLGDSLSAGRREVDTWREAVSTAATAPAAAQPPADAGSTAASPSSPIPAAPEAVAADLDRPYPAVQLAEAAVAERVLLNHIAANRGHYQAAIWAAMDASDRDALLGLYGPLGSYVENEVLGFAGDRIALPFQAGMVAGLPELMSEMGEAAVADVDPVTRQLTIPTPGVHLQSRLGACDTCEDYVRDIRAHDVEERAARAELARHQAQQANQEARRLRLRLEQQPPLLDAES